MLLDGINHLAVISKDIDKLRAFYSEVFEAEVGPTEPHGDTEFNVFTIRGNPEPDRQTPMWGRGRLDHFGLQAASVRSFDTIRERLMACGASDGNVNDFGPMRSLFFRDPDGLEGEVLITGTGM
jgi:catechol 2,3-dioxygenase-like lactoylglutathione lyase family enzyme